MTKLQGFLFGHYDSRGGATFVVADDKKEAAKKYASAMWLESEEEALEVATEDFLGAATVESDLEIEDGTDLQSYEDDAIPLWVAFVPDDPANANCHGAPGVYTLRYGGECPEGYRESELGEDAFGVILMKEGVEK